jgi:hypothetical protein
MFIYFSNQVYFENVREISYSLQKDLSNFVLHDPIGTHLTLAFKGFVVGNLIPNLIPALFGDHNSCKSGLNKQCKDNFNIYA